MGGYLPLGWADMAHWAQMTATHVRSQEWRILRAMDVAYLDACREVAKREQQSSQSPHVHSERPMTAELFDALWD
jgi:hypothetical protein